ncbi:S66 peptidase family protein [Bacillus salitolerans]|uniref:S66 peptidase family protein n=1 Tax=Bacillus salitolerans TaxID=1437434 RepID=A0ABW4LV78_9BACI
MIPKKLQRGDHIRVISPATSLAVITEEQRCIARKRFNELGISVSFSRHSEEMNSFGSSTIESRIEDLHEAFRDSSVNGILTTLGGFNSNQLLKYIDFELIQNNPKILCGYSDITALQTAIYKKTGVVTYSGPHFSTFSMKYGFEYTFEHFQRVLMQSNEPVSVTPSNEWSDDAWYLDQENRQFVKNDGWKIIQEGEAEGVVLGGNLCTLNLLQGTEFFPTLHDIILFIEDDYMTIPETFDRDLQSLLHVTSMEHQISAVVIGRFQQKSGMTMETLREIIHSKKELHDIPVIADVNFGHVSPIFTFPIGGRARLKVVDSSIGLTFTTF